MSKKRRMRLVAGIISLFAAPMCAQADVSYLCDQSRLSGTSLRNDRNSSEAFSDFQRLESPIKIVVDATRHVGLFFTVKNGAWKKDESIVFGEVDPVAKTVLGKDITDNLSIFYLIQTEGEQIAILKATIEHIAGRLGAVNTITSSKGICRKISE